MPQTSQRRLKPFGKLKLSCCRKRHSCNLLELSLDRHAFCTRLRLLCHLQSKPNLRNKETPVIVDHCMSYLLTFNTYQINNNVSQMLHAANAAPVGCHCCHMWPLYTGCLLTWNDCICLIIQACHFVKPVLVTANLSYVKTRFTE